MSRSQKAFAVLGKLTAIALITVLIYGVMAVGFWGVDEANGPDWIDDVWLLGFWASLIVAGFVGRLA